MSLDVADLNERLAGREIAWQVEHVAETGSTNVDMVARARSGAPEGLVIVADSQHGGKARQGRVWVDRGADDLLFSLLLRPDMPVEQYGLLALLSGVSVVGALVDASGGDFGAKWPNDVVIGGQKVAGILVEASTEAGWAVIGIGINLLGPASSLAAGLTETATTVYEASGKALTREDALVGVLQKIERHYASLLSRGPEGVLWAYRDADTVVGRDVRYVRDGQELGGTAVAIDRLGRLVLSTPDGAVTTEAGEVHIVG